MNMAYVQYQDLRSANYEEGLNALVGEINRVRMTVPNHFLYRDYFRQFHDLRTLRSEGREVARQLGSQDKKTSYVGRKPLPDGFVAITLGPWPDHTDTSVSADVIAVKPAAFVCTSNMINELFNEYIHKLYEALTYGDKWFLCTDWPHGLVSFGFQRRFVLPWSWIRAKKPLAGWTTTMVEPPSFYGVTPGSAWTISAKKPQHPVVFAANEEQILRAMISRVKVVMIAMRSGDIVDVTPDCAEMSRFRFTALVDACGGLERDCVAGGILAPKEPLSESFCKELGFWSATF
jgi:hypothetical protein